MSPEKSARSVLHVLPHPGGGGDTYVAALATLDEYRADRTYLAPSADSSPLAAARRALGVRREAKAHSILHVHGEVASALCLPGFASRPSVVTLHGLHLLRRVGGAKRELAKVNLRLILRAATRTICVSEAEYTEL